ncbi:MAG: hypothetical protein ACF8QF_01105 [Phycisphaerales bacterium]
MSPIARSATGFAAALVLASGLAAPAHAGFTDGRYGAGYNISALDGLDADGSGMIDNGEVATAAQTAYLNAIIANFADVTNTTEALARAKRIKDDICKAIDMVKCRDAAIGACLEKAKKNGTLCISFTMPANVAGVAAHDGKTACTANDKLKIGGQFLQGITRKPNGEPFLWDNQFMELMLTLLHEGKHAIQDYSPSPTPPGADACKIEAARNKKRACNEAEMAGANMGAQVCEQEWIAEIKAALDALKATNPEDPDPTAPGTSEATKKIIAEIRTQFPANGDKAARDAIIDGLMGYICGVDDRTDRIVTCYGFAKLALQAFIDSNYSGAAAKAVALKALRDSLNNARWSVTISRYAPRVTQFSNGGSGDIEQWDELGNLTLIPTGMGRVSDMELLFGDESGVLMVTGGDPVLNTGQIQIYIDNNADGAFQQTELAQVIVGPPGFGANTEIIDMSLVGASPILLDLDTGACWPTFDVNADDIPDNINPPVYQTQEIPHFIQSAALDPAINAVVLTPYETDDRAAWLFDEPLLILPGQNFDGDPFNDTELLVPTYDAIAFPPAFNDPPADGATTMDLAAQLDPAPPIRADVFFDVVVVNLANTPVETLASGLVAGADPFAVALSRPVALGDRIRIDDSNGRSSHVHTVACDGVGADINGDGAVNGADLGLLLGAWGSASPCFDLTGDGVTDGADLGLLLGAWS